jgi:glucosylceramidase
MEAAGYGDKKIVVWDHNRDLMSDRANVIFDDPEAAKYAWGIGNHWYENWTGGKEKHENLAKIKEAYPDKEILFTEGCNESFDSTKYYYWPNAERYIRNMINDFNAGSTGWTDWNILLDQNGGPNHVSNLCFAPVHGDIEKDELVFTPTFYALGHFSKFVAPGAKRLATTTSRSPILSVSYQNPDGSIAAIVYNISDEPINYRLYINRKATELEIEAKSLQTVVVK